MKKRKSDCLSTNFRVLSPAELNEKTGEPYFITHLFAPERIHDCYFILGEKLGSYMCRVGAVKLMLLAHSPYFRSILQEAKKSEPEMITAPDLTAPIVKNLLRYIYGYDNTSTLSFDEANGLFYAADKFLLDSLRNNLAVRLSSMLNNENICILLNNPACSQQLSLRSSINKILQYETDKVLATPSFLDINPDAFVKILELESLSIPEIELWRAALDWARARVGSSEGQALRTELETPLKHLRLCTLTPVDLCKEVIPTGVLTDAEVRLVTTAVGLGEKQSELTMICNETRCRGKTEPPDTAPIHVTIFPGLEAKSRTKVMNMNIITKDRCLELMSFEFTAKQNLNPYILEEKDSYECGCSIQFIDQLTDARIYVGFYKQIRYGELFSIPIVLKGKNVILKPDSEYLVRIVFTDLIGNYSSYYTSSFSNQHLEVRFSKQRDSYQSAIKNLTYKCVSN